MVYIEKLLFNKPMGLKSDSKYCSSMQVNPCALYMLVSPSRASDGLSICVCEITTP